MLNKQACDLEALMLYCAKQWRVVAVVLRIDIGAVFDQ
jgi:hypothetical protein